jgi:hypothetical protein
MRPTLTRDATHNFQAPENWQPETDGDCGDLQVRAETFGGREIVELFSTWKPNAEEVSKLMVGGVVEIGICTVTQPVMQVRVVDPVVAPVTDERPAGLTINEEAHGHG